MKFASGQQGQMVNEVQPLCPVFTKCGGCLYQNISYRDELAIKNKQIKDLLNRSVGVADNIFMPIVPSPKPYHYRNRLDMKLKRVKNGDVFIGFTPVDSKGVLSVDACFIAEENISRFIPQLKEEAIDRLPKKYRMANLTVRTGHDGRIHWGGIGRRSCELPEKDYLWTNVEGRKVFYSLDTFFQANLSILPDLFKTIKDFPFWEPVSTFYDLYGGVGLFSIGLTDAVKRAVLIEENAASIKLAKHNVHFNRIDNIEIFNGKVEDLLPGLLNKKTDGGNAAMIDPPRAGLSADACRLLAGLKNLQYIFYLSCNPASLANDLVEFVRQGWEVKKVIPFDFFPKTKHLETLVLLKS